MILCLTKKYESNYININFIIMIVKLASKLIKLDSEKGNFKGGFGTLTLSQLDKLRGGKSSEVANNCGGNCDCSNDSLFCSGNRCNPNPCT